MYDGGGGVGVIVRRKAFIYGSMHIPGGICLVFSAEVERERRCGWWIEDVDSSLLFSRQPSHRCGKQTLRLQGVESDF